MESGIIKSLAKVLHLDSKKAADSAESNVLSTLKNMHSLAVIHNNIYNDYTKESEYLKYVIRDEFNNISDILFKLLNIMYEEFNDRLDIFKRVLRYNEIDFVISCDKDMLNFMSDDIANEILQINTDLMKTSKYSEVDNNFENIKNLLNNSSLKLASAALLCMQNYPYVLYKNISYQKFLKSNDEHINALVNKIMTDSDECTLYDKMAYLHKVPIFSLIEYDELYNLSLSTKVKSFPVDKEIITQGDKAGELYILTSGEVEILIDNKRINTLEDGDFFGEIAIVADRNRTATVRSISDCVTLKLSTRKFKDLIFNNPKISLDVMKEITNRLLYNSSLN